MQTELCIRVESELTYWRYALFSGTNLVLLFMVAMCGSYLIGPIVILAALIFDVITTRLIARLRIFRRWVDDERELDARRKAEEERAELVKQMSERHRRELEDIEATLECVRKAMSAEDAAVQSLLDDHLGLSRLARTYVRLSGQHRRITEIASSTSRARLDEEIMSLSTLEARSSERVRPLAARRLSLARRRLRIWEETQEELEMIEQLLATIAEFIRLVHQQCVAHVDVQGQTRSIDELLETLEENGGSLRELAMASGE